MTSRLIPIVSLSLFASPLTLMAQNEEELELMKVYATRTSDSIHDTPASVTILERSDIDKFDSPGANLSTVLGKMLPGFGAPTESVSSFGQTLRGRDVLILIDGIPQIENRQISRQLNNVKVESIARVEVISGANAIYGSGAPGGIINIITKSYSTEAASFETYFGTSFASKPLSNRSQTYNTQQTVSGTLGSWKYLASIGAEARNNRFDSSGKIIPPEPAQTSRSDTDSYDVLLKGLYQITPDSFVEANLQLFQEKQDTDYVAMLNPYRGEAGLELDEQPESKRKQIGFRYESGSFFGQNLSVLAYHRNRELSFFPFYITVPAPIVNQSRTFAEVTGAKAVVETRLAESVEMAWGLDLERDKGKQRAHSYSQLRYQISEGKIYNGKSADYDYGPVIETDKAGLFTQFKVKITDLLKSKFGLRYEQISQKVHDFTPPLETAISKNWPVLYAGVGQLESLGRVPAGTTASLPTVFVPDGFEGGTLDYDAFASNLGFTYDVGPKHLLFLNFSQGYELGDTARLMRDAVSPNSLIPKISPIFRLEIDSTTVASLDLEAIKTTSYEFGWRGSVDRMFGNAAIYYNESDKVYQFNSDFTVDLLNLKKRVYGAEVDVGVRATDDLTLGVSHARAKGESRRVNGSGWAKLSGLEVSPPKSSAYADYTFSSVVRGDLQAQHIAAYGDEDDLNTADSKEALNLKEYFLLDGNLDFKVMDNASFKFGITNILDRRYKTLFHQWAEHTYGAASGAPAEGRRITLLYRQTF